LLIYASLNTQALSHIPSFSQTFHLLPCTANYPWDNQVPQEFLPTYLAMESTKTLMPLDRWLQAVKADETQILQLAKNDKIIVYDHNRNFMKPICCDGEWKFEEFGEVDLVT
jgi:hypothetical protein